MSQNTRCPDEDGRPNDPVHVKSLESEHLLDAEPGNDLSAGKDESEIDTDNPVGPMGLPRFGGRLRVVVFVISPNPGGEELPLRCRRSGRESDWAMDAQHS